MDQHKMEDGSYAKEDERVSVGSIADPPVPGKGQVLRNGKSVDIPETSQVQVARMGMVVGVCLPPVCVGGQSQDADPKNRPDPGLSETGGRTRDRSHAGS
jgi:hypothetical protein